MNCLTGNVLNDAMSIVTKWLFSTPTDCLSIPLGIQPAEVCQQGATLSLAYSSLMDLKHLLYQLQYNDTAHHCRRGETTIFESLNRLMKKIEFCKQSVSNKTISSSRQGNLKGKKNMPD